MKRLIWAGGSALVLCAGLTLAGTAAGATAHQPDIPPPHGVTIVPGGQHTNGPALTQSTSDNWGGYADVGSAEDYTKVKSSWVQPTVTCNPNISGYQWTVWWVGIDGWNDGTVEQDGTEAYCQGGQGPVYGTWWEHYPVNDIQTVSTAVQPGDHLTSVVTRSGTKYTVKVTDATTPAASFTHKFSCSATACADTSAEWIAESPGGDSATASGLYPLAKFTKWTNSASVVANATKSGHITAFPDTEITMISAETAGETKATPSALNSTGSAFSVTWKNYGP
jgi:Peptidase A4 family